MNHEVSGEEADLLEGTGAQTLNGRQAVAYMRIRKVGNGELRTHGTSTPCHYISRSKSFLI